VSETKGFIKVGNGLSYNGDTIEGMRELIKQKKKVDFVLTSPPYNMRGHEKEMYNKAETFRDNKSNEEYKEWIVSLFEFYNKLLVDNGVIIFNLNYISSKKNNASNLFKIITSIEDETPFTLIDQICWKKNGAMPISEARLSRVWENVWIYIRKKDWETFQAKYKSILVGKPNYIEAPNNDGVNELNKACFSSNLVEQLLKIYNIEKKHIVLDNFMGTHTTGIACEKIGCHWIGIELDEETFVYGIDRISNFKGNFSKVLKYGKDNLFNIE
jgi:DNA modification methylase